MTLPSSGLITMSQVNTELSKSATAAISLNDADVRALAGVPSGAIALSNLHGKSATVPPTISIASYTNGNSDVVTLNLGGTPLPTTTGAWVSGGSLITVVKNSETQYTFTKNGGAGSASGTYRFTATNSAGSATVDQSITVFEPSSCFPAGSLVSMADGSYRAIETIAVGEWVKTAVGIAQVSAIDMPILGFRPFYEMADGKCRTSGEHSLWSRDPASGAQWWATRDLEQWRLEALTGAGPNFNGHEPFNLSTAEGASWDFAVESGWIASAWRRIEAAPDTQLYHLLLTTGGSYFVDGYLVSSIADTGGVDWESFIWPHDGASA